MTKGELRTYIQNMVNRQDLTDVLTDQYLYLAHQRIQRTLRIPAMEQTLIYNVADSTLTAVQLPNNFLELIHLINADGDLLTRMNFEELLNRDDSWRPLWFAREKSYLHIRGSLPAGEDLKLMYYSEIPDFIDDNDFTAISQTTPDLLAYTTASYLADYFVDERRAMWEERAAQIFEDVTLQSDMAEFSGGVAIQVGPYAGMF